MKRHIADEADAQLAYYLPLPADQIPPPEVTLPPRPQLPEGVVDTPLVRVYNFLRAYLDMFFRSLTVNWSRNDVTILPVGDSLVSDLSILTPLYQAQSAPTPAG